MEETNLTRSMNHMLPEGAFFSAQEVSILLNQSDGIVNGLAAEVLVAVYDGPG